MNDAKLSKHVWIGILALVLLSGCLKTRSQLKGEEDETPSAAAAPAQPPPGQYAVDEIKSEMTRLIGRVEDLERSNKREESGGQTAKAEELKKLEERIAQLEQTQMQMIEAIKKIEGGVARTDNPDELFISGVKNFKSGRYDNAIKSFAAYLETPKPKNQVEATFFRGEAYFELKQYKKAIVDYSKFAEKKMGQSSYVPKALYKLGMSFEGLGRKEDARAFFDELIDSYPKSKEAKKAKARIKSDKKS